MMHFSHTVLLPRYPVTASQCGHMLHCKHAPHQGRALEPRVHCCFALHLHMANSPVVSTPANSPSEFMPRGVCRISESSLLVPLALFPEPLLDN